VELARSYRLAAVLPQPAAAQQKQAVVELA
jgi:hypothetical protein